MEIDCRYKKHLACDPCIRNYIKENGNHCPFHENVKQITFQPSKFVNYHLKTLQVSCNFEKLGIFGLKSVFCLSCD